MVWCNKRSSQRVISNSMSSILSSMIVRMVYIRILICIKLFYLFLFLGVSSFEALFIYWWAPCSKNSIGRKKYNKYCKLNSCVLSSLTVPYELLLICTFFKSTNYVLCTQNGDPKKEMSSYYCSFLGLW